MPLVAYFDGRRQFACAIEEFADQQINEPKYERNQRRQTLRS
jgi:hypothetical protein